MKLNLIVFTICFMFLSSALTKRYLVETMGKI